MHVCIYVYVYIYIYTCIYIYIHGIAIVIIIIISDGSAMSRDVARRHLRTNAPDARAAKKAGSLL